MARRRLNPDAPPLTGAERQRRYRERLRKAGLMERWVAKDAATSIPEEVARQIVGDDPNRLVRLQGEFRHSDEIADGESETFERRTMH